MYTASGENEEEGNTLGNIEKEQQNNENVMQADSTVNDECDMEPYAVTNMSDHEAYLNTTTNVRTQAPKSDSIVTDDGDMEPYAVTNMCDHETYFSGTTSVHQQALDDSSQDTTKNPHKPRNPPNAKELCQNPMYIPNNQQANKLCEKGQVKYSRHLQRLVVPGGEEQAQLVMELRAITRQDLARTLQELSSDTTRIPTGHLVPLKLRCFDTYFYAQLLKYGNRSRAAKQWSQNLDPLYVDTWSSTALAVVAVEGERNPVPLLLKQIDNWESAKTGDIVTFTRSNAKTPADSSLLSDDCVDGSKVKSLRGTGGTKEILVTRVFAAWENDTPVQPTAAAHAATAEKEYSDLLEGLGDPLKFGDQVWMPEADGIQHWPNIIEQLHLSLACGPAMTSYTTAVYYPPQDIRSRGAVRISCMRQASKKQCDRLSMDPETMESDIIQRQLRQSGGWEGTGHKISMTLPVFLRAKFDLARVTV
ncbi:hypothetical protein Bbelb_352570, partial [Branchiostoma belcheri]